jgi:predicted esterase
VRHGAPSRLEKEWVAPDGTVRECWAMTDAGYELVWHDAHRQGAGLMVVLHGFAEHPVAALQLGSMLDPRRRYAVCAPVAPIRVGDHKRAFYRSKSRMEPDPASFGAARLGVGAAVDRACAELSVERGSMVLVGFSQGGGLALAEALGRSSSPAPGSTILFSARPYPHDLVDWDYSRAEGMALFVAHGIRDRLSPLADLQAFFERVDPARCDPVWRTHPFGHTLEPASVAAASEWLYRQ